MFTRFATCLIPALVASVGLSMDAHSATNGAGVTLKAYYPGDASCFVGFSYGGITNSCSTARWVSTSLSVPSGWHNTSITVFGNNSFCHTVSTSGNGNGDNVGADTWTLAGPKAWNNLNTGSRFVWDGSPVLFECLLEAGGVIGAFTAQ